MNPEGENVDLEKIISYELAQLRPGALISSDEIRFFAKVDGFDIDFARKQTITNVIDKLADRVEKPGPKYATVWRVRP